MQCKYCGRNNHNSKKFWEKFGRPEWAQLTDADTLAAGDIAHVQTLSAPHSGSSGPPIVLSQEKYDRLC